MVIRVVTGILGDPGMADDVAQEVFVKMYKNLDQLGDPSAIPSWLYRVAVNQAIDMLRARERYREEVLEDVISAEADPQMQIEKFEQAKFLHNALDLLSTDHRVVLILRELEGRSYEEIANILSVPVGTVESRIARARKALKNILFVLVEKQNG